MKSSWLTGFALLILFVSLIYIGSTFIPVVVIELKYRTMKLRQSVLGNTPVAQLFIPNFTFSKLSQAERAYAIEIPEVFIHEPVIFNVDPSSESEYSEALTQGIAHAAGSGLPGSEQLGYYFAHSSNPEFRNQYNAIFYLLHKLESGDPISIWHSGEKYTYTVTHTEITDPDYTEFMRAEYDQETIVLQTCWPPGTTAKRLLVFAQKQ
ncbi:sortase [Candidatus Woesebacteria bacterium]|nr:sortase [Candidatus Woesebacteria bacterium]